MRSASLLSACQGSMVELMNIHGVFTVSQPASPVLSAQRRHRNSCWHQLDSKIEVLWALFSLKVDCCFALAFPCWHSVMPCIVFFFTVIEIYGNKWKLASV